MGPYGPAPSILDLLRLDADGTSSKHIRTQIVVKNGDLKKSLRLLNYTKNKEPTQHNTTRHDTTQHNTTNQASKENQHMYAAEKPNTAHQSGL